LYNPLDTLRKFQARIGKPIRPIIELQKNGSVVNILTKTIQCENMINDPMRTEAWELHPDTKASAIYVDGVFKGMGFFAGEEGHILNYSLDEIREDQREEILTEDLLGIEIGTTVQVKKEVELYTEVLDKNGVPVLDAAGNRSMVRVLNAAYKGLNGKLLDASIIERGSALKPSMTQTLVYCGLVGFTMFMMGMSWQ
jgi:hypothetical protein